MSGSFDLGEGLVANIALDLPGSKRVALVEDLINLFERASLGLGVHEQDMDKPSSVKSSEDKVGFIRLLMDMSSASISSRR